MRNFLLYVFTEGDWSLELTRHKVKNFIIIRVHDNHSFIHSFIHSLHEFLHIRQQQCLSIYSCWWWSWQCLSIHSWWWWSWQCYSSRISYSSSLFQWILGLCNSTKTEEIFLLSSAAIANMTFMDSTTCEILQKIQAPRILCSSCHSNIAKSLFSKDQVIFVLSFSFICWF